MFYHVSKIAWVLIDPANLLLALTAIGLLLSTFGFARFGRRLAIIATLAMVMLGLSPVANWLLVPLEMRFPVPALEGKKIDGIIVLGGAVQERQTIMHGPLSFNDAGERILAMADLARRYPTTRVVFTGGAGSYINAPKPEGLVVQDNLAVLGLAPDRILIESQSVNTHENAVFTKAIINPQPGETWLLVTSAWHMPRSVGIFRQAGWPVVAYPVDFRTAGWEEMSSGFSSVSDGMRRLETGLREWIGLVAYRLTGRSNAFFPAP